MRLGATGFALIAVCYGFARFAFGLFLPEIRIDLAMTPTISGFIAGGSFLGYCIAIVASTWLTERYGAHMVAVGAGLIAATGLALIAVAPSAPILAGAVLFAGLSSGLASPPLAAAVIHSVTPARRDAINTIINAGTSAGLALSGPVALLLGADWRLAFAIFAGASLIVTVTTFAFVPPDRPREAIPFRGLPKPSGDLVKVVVAAFLTGAASTAIWSFGGELLTRSLDWTGQRIGILWIVIGAAGGIGGFAGSLVSRFGMNVTHAGSLIVLAVSTITIGYSGTTSPVVFGGGMLFGAAYIMLTGIYLVWGIAALPDRPAAGLTIAFLMFGIGQTVGAPVFGFLLERTGPDVAVTTFATLGLLASLSRRRRENRPVLSA